MQFWDKSQAFLGAKAPLGLVRVSELMTKKLEISKSLNIAM